MLEESEVINLVLILFWLLAVGHLYRNVELPRLPFLYAGVLFMLCGYVFTVLEEAAFYEAFNLLEHLSYAIAGILIAIGCRRLAESGSRDRKGKTEQT